MHIFTTTILAAVVALTCQVIKPISCLKIILTVYGHSQSIYTIDNRLLSFIILDQYTLGSDYHDFLLSQSI